MSETFHLGSCLTRWHSATRYDVSASHSEVLPPSALLALAGPRERASWEQGPLDYARLNGSVGLRKRVACQHNSLQARDIVCCAGAQAGIVCVASALLTQGDRAIVVLRIYPPLEWAVTDRGPATGVSLRSDCLALDLQHVAAAVRPKTITILMNVPKSQTGVVLNTANQAPLVELRRARGIGLMNDEVYRQTIDDPDGQPPQIADVHERGLSVTGLSKGLGLPGLRVGWVACRDENFTARVFVAKAALSSYLAARSEALVQISLREYPRLMKRAREIGLSNCKRRAFLLHQHGHVFQADMLRNPAFGFPGYRGKEGTEVLAAPLVTKTEALVPPGSLWRPALGAVPRDHLRMSLGQASVPAGLEAMDAYLAMRAVA